MKGMMEDVRETENKRRLGELLNPLLLNSTNPGGLLPMVEVIQSWYWEILAYTPGYLGSAHPLPKLTTPDWIHREPLLVTNGPPESPCIDKHKIYIYLIYVSEYTVYSEQLLKTDY